MKELINKFKKLDQAKRIVILFITISFVFIAGFSFYNGISGNYQNRNTAQVTQIKETKKKNTKKNKVEKQENKEDTNTQQKESTQQEESTNKEENTTQEDKTKKDDSSKQETKNETSKSTNQSTASSTIKSTESTHQSSNTTTENNNKATSDITQNQNDNKITVNVQVIGVDSTLMSGSLSLEKNTSVYSALKTLASQQGVSISTSGFGSTTYVRGIGGLYEFDYGGNSGWLYMVNGVKPNYGAYSYKLNDGDTIKWYYTTDYTKD